MQSGDYESVQMKWKQFQGKFVRKETDAPPTWGCLVCGWPVSAEVHGGSDSEDSPQGPIKHITHIYHKEKDFPGKAKREVGFVGGRCFK